MGLLDRLLTFGDPPAPEPAPVPVPVMAPRPTRAEAMASRLLQGAPAAPDEQGKRPNERDREWQGRAWLYTRQVGELHYARDFVGSCFSRLALTLGVMTKTGVVVPAFDDEGNPLDGGGGVIDSALEILADLKGPIGGQRMLQRQCGEGLFTAGEMFLLGTDVPASGMATNEGTGGGQWELCSTSEIKVSGDKRHPKYERRAPGSGTKGEQVPASTMVARIWKPDAEYGEQADSSVRGVLDVAGELVWLDRLIKGTTRSRLAGSGVYWVANEIDYQPASNVQYPEGVDPFTFDFIRAGSAPLEDPDSASSAVPFVVRAPHEYIKDGVRHDEFGKGLADFPAIELRREAVDRLARGITLPMEVLTGQGATNHWSAFQIDASLFRAHIEPLAEVMVDGFTGGYLHPMMKAAGLAAEVNITLPNGNDVDGTLVVTYDATELISYPNRSADADAAWDRIEISGTTYRKAKGFTEGDKPDDDEVEERIRRMKAIKSGPAQPGGGGGAEDTPDDANPGEPEGTDQAGARTHQLGTLAMRVADAADPFVKRVVERVGAKLVSACEGAKQQQGAQLRDAIKGVSNREVAATLGPERVAHLVNVDRLLVSEFGPLVGSVREWAEQTGHPDVDPVHVATAVGDRCVQLAKVRLFQPSRPVLASDFLDVVAPELVP
jgi:hypothetical protein